MQAARAREATIAAVALARSLGLPAETATVLHSSNKLTLRLSPCEVVARVAPETEVPVDHDGFHTELEIASRLLEADCPVGAPDPRVEARVHRTGGFAITLWTHYPQSDQPLTPAGYADALYRLHRGMRTLAIPLPLVTERIDSAVALVSDLDQNLDQTSGDRALLLAVLDDGRRLTDGPTQVLHGEPHPGNLLATIDGPRFIDFETCCRGPVEFDVAHAPDGVADLYPGVDSEVLSRSRRLMLALMISWRWDPGDQFPDGRRLGRDWLTQLRALLPGD